MSKFADVKRFHALTNIPSRFRWSRAQHRYFATEDRNRCTINHGDSAPEYIYGVWVQAAGQNLSLLGSPVSYKLQSLVVEPPIVSGSIIINYSYPIIQFELPVQVDLWLRFTDELQISSYDLTFRRWPAAFEYFIPKLLPSIAAASGQTLTSDSNTTAIIARFLAQQICSVSTEYCVGDNQQYNS